MSLLKETPQCGCYDVAAVCNLALFACVKWVPNTNDALLMELWLNFHLSLMSVNSVSEVMSTFVMVRKFLTYTERAPNVL